MRACGPSRRSTATAQTAPSAATAHAGQHHQYERACAWFFRYVIFWKTIVRRRSACGVIVAAATRRLHAENI